MPRALEGDEPTESEREEKHWLAVQRGGCLDRQEERVRVGWREGKNREINKEEQKESGDGCRKQESFGRKKNCFN